MRPEHGVIDGLLTQSRGQANADPQNPADYCAHHSQQNRINQISAEPNPKTPVNWHNIPQMLNSCGEANTARL